MDAGPGLLSQDCYAAQLTFVIDRQQVVCSACCYGHGEILAIGGNGNMFWTDCRERERPPREKAKVTRASIDSVSLYGRGRPPLIIAPAICDEQGRLIGRKCKRGR